MSEPSSTPTPTPRHALLVGATGLVGRYLLVQLLADRAYGRVTVLARRPLPLKHPKLTVQIVDFDNLADYRNLISGDDLFCALGTTRKAAGSRAAFEQVDYDYVQMLATLAEQRGFKRFLLVSALGANSKSPFLYNRVKGHIEETISAMRFQSIHIFRPSLLLGPRREKRSGEERAKKIMPWLRPLLMGKLRRYRPVEALEVAQAMIRAAKRSVPGLHWHYMHVAPPDLLQTKDASTDEPAAKSQQQRVNTTSSVPAQKKAS